MKTKITQLLSVAMLSIALSAIGQVPNGGFESWTNGSPNSWYNTNIPTIVTNITQETPAYSGTYAVRGEVINYSGSPYSPLMASTDLSLNGFPVSQSYSTFSFYYKMNITGTATFEGSLSFYDAGGNWVASSGVIFTAGATNNYTLASFPINYGSANPPAECIIIFAIHDTVASYPPIGNYFIVDDVTLSGISGVGEEPSENYFASAFPNPAKDLVSITLDRSVSGNIEIVVYDILGNTVKKLSSAINFPFEFSVAELPAGIYSARIRSGKNYWWTKIIKE